MTKVLLDTTYLLPLAGIQVRGVQTDAFKTIRARGHEVFISDISLFEILAKGAKLVAEGRADERRVTAAVEALLNEETIRRVSAYDVDVGRVAIALRPYHSDFIDCLILASSLEECETLVTEEVAFARNEALMEFVRMRKPTFRISSLRRLLA